MIWLESLQFDVKEEQRKWIRTLKKVYSLRLVYLVKTFSKDHDKSEEQKMFLLMTHTNLRSYILLVDLILESGSYLKRI